MIAIDAPLVRRLIASQFPQWTDLTVTPVQPGGWDNRTFRLGPKMAVRLPSAGRYAAHVETEAHWLPRLAPLLPLPIPSPLAIGRPGEGYPWPWLINPWLEGETAAKGGIGDLTGFAIDLAAFLIALRAIDPVRAPAPGTHNFHRGGPLENYDGETRAAITALAGRIDAAAATRTWEAALVSAWSGAPVWVHGDISPGNLLTRNGRLAAVIDFGQLAAGDPACDLAIAWTLFEGESRRAFRDGLRLDAATCARARGWALWKALIVWAALPGANPAHAGRSPWVVEDVLAEAEA